MDKDTLKAKLNELCHTYRNMMKTFSAETYERETKTYEKIKKEILSLADKGEE